MKDIIIIIIIIIIYVDNNTQAHNITEQPRYTTGNWNGVYSPSLVDKYAASIMVDGKVSFWKYE